MLAKRAPLASPIDARIPATKVCEGQSCSDGDDSDRDEATHGQSSIPPPERCVTEATESEWSHRKCGRFTEAPREARRALWTRRLPRPVRMELHGSGWIRCFVTAHPSNNGLPAPRLAWSTLRGSAIGIWSVCSTRTTDGSPSKSQSSPPRPGKKEVWAPKRDALVPRPVVRCGRQAVRMGGG